MRLSRMGRVPIVCIAKKHPWWFWCRCVDLRWRNSDLVQLTSFIEEISETRKGEMTSPRSHDRGRGIEWASNFKSCHLQSCVFSKIPQFFSYMWVKIALQSLVRCAQGGGGSHIRESWSCHLPAHGLGNRKLCYTIAHKKQPVRSIRMWAMPL